MFCVNCGARLGEDAKFCTSCGTAVASYGSEPAADAEPVFVSAVEESPVSGGANRDYNPQSSVTYAPEPTPEPAFAPEPCAPRPAPAPRPAYDPNLFAPPVEDRGSIAMPVAALVLGILNLVLWVFPPLGLVTSLLAIIFGGIGLKKRLRGMAVAGLVIGIIMLIINILLLIALIAAGSVITGAIDGIMRYPWIFY